MNLKFPDNFLWGTSTSALQIESAKSHDWKGLKAKDGSILGPNIKHELYRKEDTGIISSIGNAYRFSMDWSSLQKEPFGKLESSVVKEYRNFMEDLKGKDMHLMLVLHHFASPEWFTMYGGWMRKHSADIFQDYASRMADTFGDLTDSWNTINEPNVYASQGFMMGNFPPHQKNIISAIHVVKNMSKAHDLAYTAIKNKLPDQEIGISNNTMIFSPKNILGVIPAKAADLFSHWYVPNQFQNVDFIGLSYYGRVLFDPNPISELDTPGKLEKLGLLHDDMWEHYPKGFTDILMRFSERYASKPIIVTEHGCCAEDDSLRIRSIKDHLSALHEAIKMGVDVKGYFHWSTFDNFELHLGPSYKFGLVGIDSKTYERVKKPSREFYSNIARNNSIEK